MPDDATPPSDNERQIRKISEEQLNRLTRTVTNLGESAKPQLTPEQLDRFRQSSTAVQLSLSPEQIERLTRSSTSVKLALTPEQIERLTRSSSSAKVNFTPEQIERLTRSSTSAKLNFTPEQWEAINAGVLRRAEIDHVRPATAVGLAQAQIAQGVATAYDATSHLEEAANGTATSMSQATTTDEALTKFETFMATFTEWTKENKQSLNNIEAGTNNLGPIREELQSGSKADENRHQTVLVIGILTLVIGILAIAVAVVIALNTN